MVSGIPEEYVKYYGRPWGWQGFMPVWVFMARYGGGVLGGGAQEQGRPQIRENMSWALKDK